jgi:predicted Zn-dependent peptidase
MIQHQLENGLQLSLERVPHVHSVAIGFLVRTGSRHEPAEWSGISHFLEHLSFRSNRTRGSHALSLAVDGMGAQWNGYTSWEGTVYYLWAPSDGLEQSLDVLVEMTQPAFRESEIEIERQVILEEIGMSEDCPDEILLDELFRMAYDGHPLGRRIAGREETVRRLTVSDLRRFHTEVYHPDNMHFVATGNFDIDSLIRGVKLRCGRWRTGGRHPQVSRPVFHAGSHGLRRPNIHQTYLAAAVAGPPLSSPDSVTAELLASYLGSEDNSRLFWAAKQRGLADEIWAHYEGFTDSGIFYVYAASAPGKAKPLIQAIRNEMLRVHTDVDGDLLARVRGKARTDLICSMENGLERLESVLERLAARSVPETLQRQLARIDGVGPRSIRHYLNRYPLGGNWASVRIGRGRAQADA